MCVAHVPAATNTPASKHERAPMRMAREVTLCTDRPFHNQSNVPSITT